MLDGSILLLQSSVSLQAPFVPPTPSPTFPPTVSSVPTTETNSPTATMNPTGTWLLEQISTDCDGDYPDWVDLFGDGCSWYETHDLPGCELYGMSYPGEMGSARDNCCYCKMVLDLELNEIEV